MKDNISEFEHNQERDDKRSALLEKSEWIYGVLCGDFDEEFDLKDFRMYFKNVWEYFSRYIGFFDIDRKDIQIINYLNRIDELLKINCYTELKISEQYTCILFLDSLIYTVSSYDFRGYKGGFYCKGVLYMCLPHHGGSSDFDEIFIDEFEEAFDRYYKYYESMEEE